MSKISYKTPEIPFVEFPKLARWARDAVVSEKLDGCNGQIYVNDSVTEVYAGSRSQWIGPDGNNFGFGRWVAEHAEELAKLGPGSHFGEWWGMGIRRRGYGIAEKRFSLFNTRRWSEASSRPACCGVVPVLWQGPFDQLDVSAIMAKLKGSGSVAAPGFMDPEGIVVFHTAGQWLLKKTFDDSPKGKQPA